MQGLFQEADEKRKVSVWCRSIENQPFSATLLY